jgi:hypothetical protein
MKGVPLIKCTNTHFLTEAPEHFNEILLCRYERRSMATTIRQKESIARKPVDVIAEPCRATNSGKKYGTFLKGKNHGK